MHEVLKRLCEKYPDVRIMRQDSYDAGNCESGTKDWAEFHFPNRRVLKVKELIPFIDDYKRASAVLIHKLRFLNNETADALEEYS